MKKIRIIQIICSVLIIVYLGLFISDIIYGYMGDLETFVFSILLTLLSISLMFKGALLKSTSTFWFAICLILIAITIIIFKLINIDIEKFYYIFFIIPLIASVLNLLVFKSKIYLKVIILNISIIIPILINEFTKINWWVFSLIFGISIIIGIFICRSINFDKEKV